MVAIEESYGLDRRYRIHPRSRQPRTYGNQAKKVGLPKGYCDAGMRFSQCC